MAAIDLSAYSLTATCDARWTNSAILRKQSVREVMTPGPRTIRPNQLAVEAVQLMEEYKITQLLAVDTDMRLVGALNMHDLMRAKVI